MPVEAFLAALADEAPAADVVATRLTDLVAAARAEHPGLALDELAFARELAARVSGDACAWLDRCHAGDLHLAIECARSEPAALAIFEATFGKELGGIARRFSSPGHGEDDLGQILRERLFVGTAGRGPKIADYAGQGFLQNWLRVAALRTFLDLGRRKDRTRESPASDEAILAVPDAGDLELDLVKAEYRAEVARALAEAAAALAPGDRHLLRQHLAGGMTIDELASVYGIHRATAARRLGRARDALLADTRAILTERLRISSEELDEVVGLVMSRLEVSVARLLETRE